VDFLVVLLELFALAVTAEAIRAISSRSSCMVLLRQLSVLR